MIKLVDSTQYHLWTDALHGRALARQAKNDWDRGTYVRWTIQSAWTAFEMVCGDVLQVKGLGMRFKERFEEGLTNNNIANVDWGSGLWQRTLQVYGVRKEFTHVQPTISQNRLLAPVAEAENAISVLRDAIKEICRLANQTTPVWVNDDTDRGWDGGPKSMAYATLIKADADPEGPNTVRISYVANGQEHISDILPPGTDHRPAFDQLLKALTIPVSCLRAYRGKELIEERQLNARGA